MKRMALYSAVVLLRCGGTAAPATTAAETCMGVPGPCPPPDAGAAATPDAGSPPAPVVFSLLYDYDTSTGFGAACYGAYHQTIGHCAQAQSLKASDLPALTVRFSTCRFSGGPSAYTIDCSGQCLSVGPYQTLCYDNSGRLIGSATWYENSCPTWTGTGVSAKTCSWVYP